MENLEVCKILEKYKNFKQETFKSICNLLNKFYQIKNNMKLRGFNDFNFINLLRGYYDENTHSKIIAEFLNPQGTHYQGKIFLNNFLEIIGIKNINNNFIIEIERYIECQDCNKMYQGRIDIFFESDDTIIILENKINAGEQELQIQKYIKCIQLENYKKLKQIIVIYLTKNGSHPSKYSLGELSIKNKCIYKDDNKLAKYINISYKNEISKWIEKNLADIENISNLREIFLQYQKAVKIITKKEESRMNLQEFLLKEENKEALIGLITNYDDFIKYIKNNAECKKIIEEENLEDALNNQSKGVKFILRQRVAKIILEQLREYAKEKNLVINENEFTNGTKWSSVDIYKNEWLQDGKIILSFSLENGQYNFYGDFYYGIRKYSEDFPYKKREIKNKILKTIIDNNKMKISNGWLLWKSFNLLMYENEFYIKVLNESDKRIAKIYTEQFIKFIEKNINLIDKYINNFKKDNN